MRRILSWLYRQMTPGRTAAVAFVAVAVALWWTPPPGPVAVIQTANQQQILALSPDGRLLATGTPLPSMRGNFGPLGFPGAPGAMPWPVTDVSLWEAATGRVVARYANPSREKFAADPLNGPMIAQCWFTTDDELLVREGGSLGDTADAVFILSPRQDQPRQLFQDSPERGSIRGYPCLPARGQRGVLLHASDRNSAESETVYLVDVATGTRQELASARTLGTPAVSADGQFLTADIDGALGVWDLDSGSCLHRLSVEAEWSHPCFSRDCHFLAAAHPQGLLLWDASSGQLLGRTNQPISLADAFWFTSDGCLCLTDQGETVCYETPSLAVRWRHALFEYARTEASPDGSMEMVINCGGGNTRYLVHDARRGHELTHLPNGGEEWKGDWLIASAAFVPKLGLLAVGRTRWLSATNRGKSVAASELMLMNPVKGAVAQRVPYSVGETAFTADGRWLAAPCAGAATDPESDPWGRPVAGPFAIAIWEVEPGRPWAAILSWATAAAAFTWLLLARPWRRWRAFRLAPRPGASV